jgi:hypothetical protein
MKHGRAGCSVGLFFPARQIYVKNANMEAENDHAIMIPKRDAQKHDLPETVELYNDPGYLFYGLGVYHQLHCLNRIRKTFYKEKFYPDEDPHMIEVHKSQSPSMFTAQLYISAPQSAGGTDMTQITALTSFARLSCVTVTFPLYTGGTTHTATPTMQGSSITRRIISTGTARNE